MSIQTQIEQKLGEAFDIDHLSVINESNNHNVPAGSESHFKVIMAAKQFTGQRALARHRAVNKVLADELANHIHALALHLYTPEEWQAHLGDAVPNSPDCLGGEKGGNNKNH